MRIGMTKIIAAGILSLTITTTVDARDRWVGDWGGECGGQDIQCRVEIVPAPAGYRISWIVADRMDGSRILCRIDAIAPRNSQRLVGKAADGQSLVVTAIRGGAAIEIEGTGIRGEDMVPCAGRQRSVAGEYAAFGDE